MKSVLESLRLKVLKPYTIKVRRQSQNIPIEKRHSRHFDIFQSPCNCKSDAFEKENLSGFSLERKRHSVLSFSTVSWFSDTFRKAIPYSVVFIHLSTAQKLSLRWYIQYNYCAYKTQCTRHSLAIVVCADKSLPPIFDVAIVLKLQIEIFLSLFSGIHS